MSIGISELLALLALFGGAFAWLNKNFESIDKRIDRNIQDINGLGARLSLFEEGTVEILGERINQMKAKQFDLEDKFNKYLEVLDADFKALSEQIKSK